jgi:zinc/manganese transport system substrate-binding protein
VEASGSDAEIVTLSDSVDVIEASEEAHSDEEGEAHAHGGEDPHVWMTAANGALMTEAVADELAEADPENADAYRERAAAYEGQLEVAQTEIAETLGPLTDEQRVLFTNHDAFGYFAAEHGFEVLGTALNSVTTEGADPSAADVAAVVEEIEESGAPAIFPENVANSDLLETIAREADVAVGPVLATGALGEEGSAAGTYLGLLQSNAEAIATSLEGS